MSEATSFEVVGSISKKVDLCRIGKFGGLAGAEF